MRDALDRLRRDRYYPGMSNDFGSNGTSGPHMFAPGSDYALPAAPSAAPELPNSWDTADPPGYQQEDQITVPVAAVPPTEHYEGGGIFASSTPGPAMQPMAPPEQQAPQRQRRGLDYGPSPAMLPPVGPPPPLPSFLPGTLPPPMGALDQRSNTLGLSILGMAAGALIGSYYGGVFGGIAGSLFFGSGINAVKAFSAYKQGTPDAEKEAKVSGTYAVAAGALGGLVWYKLVSRDHQPGWRTAAKPNRRRSYDYDDNPCDIRLVGP